MSRPSVLPRGPYYALTWTIAEEFGGLTNVFLHRAESFRAMGGQKVQLLTLSPGLNPRKAKARLLQHGLVNRRMPLRNMWWELEHASDRKLRAIIGSAGLEAVAPPRDLPYEKRRETVLLNENEKALQVDRFRSNGTRYATDQKDAKKPGTVGGRRVTLYSRRGVPLASFNTMAALQSAWLDWVIGKSNAFLLNDSQFLADYVAGYRRPNVVTVQALHNLHLQPAAPSLYGPLSKSKAGLLRRIDDYDLMAVLTEKQGQDLIHAGFGDEDIRVIPNSRALPPAVPVERRDPNRGVMAVRLSWQKHPQEAVRVMIAAHRLNPSISLDFYGDGYEAPKVSALVEEAHASSYIRLKGYDSAASEQFKTASFSLLTSRFEGQGLVLLESMAAGCIPIAYDIRYGPSDIITDGVDGFLVPSGDTEGMARVIDGVSRMPEPELAAMRVAARKRAEDFSDAALLPTWGRELERARRRHRSVRLAAPALTDTRLEYGDGELMVSCVVSGAPAEADTTWFVAFDVPKQPHFGRVPAVLSHREDGAAVLTASIPLERLMESPLGSHVHFSVDVVVPGDHRRVKLPAVPGLQLSTPAGPVVAEKNVVVLQRTDASAA